MSDKITKHPALITFIVLLTICISYSYHFHGKAYDNALSRLDLAFSIVQKGTLSIDDYHGNTVDKAYYKGHYYCDKAPGLSLAAVPAVYMIKTIFPSSRFSPEDRYARFAITFLVIGLPSVLLFLIIAGLTRRMTETDSLFPAIVYSLGSMALPYSMMFYSHQFCAFLLAAAFYFHYRTRTGEDSASFSSGIIIGFLSGFAFISEYPAAVPAAVIVASSFILSGNSRHRIGLVMGMIIPLIALGAYNFAVFEHPLRIGYEFEANNWFRDEMGKGLGGVGMPRPGIVYALLFGSQKGLFWGQPFLLISIPGIVLLYRKSRIHREYAIILSIIILTTILINAGYYEPHGGFAPGPRFLVWSLPFWFLAASCCWVNFGTVSRAFATGAGVFSILYYTAIVSVEPHVPHVFDSPIFNFVVPLVRAGWDLTNLGTLSGISSIFSLVPLLLVVMTTLLVFLIKEFRGSDFFESGGGVISGFLAVTVAFLISTYVSKPEPAESAYYLGAALNGNGKYHEAEDYLLYSISIRPNFRQARYALGIAQIKNDKYNDAVQSFREYTELEPSDRQGYISLVAAQVTAGRYEEAMESVHYSLSLFPGDNTLSGLESIIKKQFKSVKNNE